MSETIARPTLDKVQIAAMRKADRIVLRHLPGKGSAVECVKEKRPTEKDPYASDVTVAVPCEFFVEDYGQDTRSEEFPSEPKALDYDARQAGNFYGFEHLSGTNFAWQTAVDSMKAGDVIKLRWLRSGGTSPAIYKLGVVADMLELQVMRGNVTHSTFLIACHAYPATAEGLRMVRTRRY